MTVAGSAQSPETGESTSVTVGSWRTCDSWWRSLRPGSRIGPVTRAGSFLVCAAIIGFAGPVRAQCPDGSPPPCARVPAPSPNSVAVLLFDNVARDSAFAYLGDGLASEIATSLAGVPRLEVRSPGLVRRLQQGAQGDPQLLGRRLNVRYVVEGDYQRGGDRIHVAVRLTTVATGTTRWSHAYTRSSTDLLAVQEDVAREVATSIAGQLLPRERTVLAEHPTRNPDAWDHFLRGNYLLARRTQDGVEHALDEYAMAARLDPAFAQAEARIALGYALDLDWGWPVGLPAETLLARGLRAADRALDRDSLSADGWMARGYLLGFKTPGDYTLVMPAVSRAVALDPHNAETIHQLASKLQELDYADSAIALERRALAEDPDRAISQLIIGKAYMNLHRLDEARHALDSSLAIDPAFYASAVYLSEIAFERGDVAGGCRHAANATSGMAGSDPWRFSVDAACLVARGDTAGAISALKQATEQYDTASAVSIYPVVFAAYAYLRLGRIDDAVHWIERASPRGAILWSELLSPMFDPLRRDPRFQRFMTSIRPIGAAAP